MMPSSICLALFRRLMSVGYAMYAGVQVASRSMWPLFEVSLLLSVFFGGLLLLLLSWFVFCGGLFLFLSWFVFFGGLFLLFLSLSFPVLACKNISSLIFFIISAGMYFLKLVIELAANGGVFVNSCSPIRNCMYGFRGMSWSTSSSE